jgi:DNA-binding LacI/PurR family transcriptional regulator
MATINDVARAASVSTATVSAVVNESAFVSPQLRARVLAAMALVQISGKHRHLLLRRADFKQSVPRSR